MATKATMTLADTTKLVADMVRMLSHPDQEDDGEYEAKELFPQVFRVHDYETDGNREVATIDCGGMRHECTPKGLYRVLFLAEPKRVDFSDMYKSGSLFSLVSPCGNFTAEIEFFKYEFAVYFTATREHVKGKQSWIVAGAPEADNGVSGASKEFVAWSGLLKACLNREWTVYSGNDFRV